MTRIAPPSVFQEQFRKIGHSLPYTKTGKKLASVLLRLAGGTSGQAFDVTVFETQKARLHPYDNISEKRVYITPQFWDPTERAFLEEFISHHDTDDFTFVDIGANAGMYSLFTRATCQKFGKKASIIAVEPDPLMHARMKHNIVVSDATEQTTMLDWAITAERQEVHLELNSTSRGMNKLSDKPPSEEEQIIKVAGHPLLDIYAETGLKRIDAMKMDIEGAEFPALAVFFQKAEDWQKPSLFIIETSHEDDEESALGLCFKNGYEIALQNDLNSILLKN